jgi:hypothetical protein
VFEISGQAKLEEKVGLCTIVLKGQLKKSSFHSFSFTVNACIKNIATKLISSQKRTTKL